MRLDQILLPPSFQTTHYTDNVDELSLTTHVRIAYVAGHKNWLPVKMKNWWKKNKYKKKKKKKTGKNMRRTHRAVRTYKNKNILRSLIIIFGLPALVLCIFIQSWQVNPIL